MCSSPFVREGTIYFQLLWNSWHILNENIIEIKIGLWKVWKKDVKIIRNRSRSFGTG